MALDKNLTEDPAIKFDRTNITSGIFQMRELISQALNYSSPLLKGEVYEAVALWISQPQMIADFRGELANGNLDLKNIFLPQMKRKIYFRVPVVHRNLPLPNNFSKTSSSEISLLKPEERNDLLISCHPHLYVLDAEYPGIVPGDIFNIRFLDASFAMAEIVLDRDMSDHSSVKKSTNNIPSRKFIFDFTKSVVDLFDDAGETAILGSDIKISPEAKRIGKILYNNMKERDACTFLKFWKEKWFKKIEGVPAAARNYPAAAAAIKEASKAYNLNEEMMRGIARIESGFNPLAGPNARSGALGLYQILPGFKKRYGVTDITILDPNLHALAVAKVLSQNIEDATFRLGRPPEPWEVYVMHNQGPDGFYAQSVACRLYGPGGGKEEIQRAIQLIINNNFIGSYQGSTPQSGRFFIGGSSKKVSITNPEHHAGLKPDLQSLRNLKRT
jgi:hypothetical protein